MKDKVCSRKAQNHEAGDPSRTRTRKGGNSGLLQQAVLEARLQLFPVEVPADEHNLVDARLVGLPHPVGRSLENVVHSLHMENMDAAVRSLNMREDNTTPS